MLLMEDSSVSLGDCEEAAVVYRAHINQQTIRRESMTDDEHLPQQPQQQHQQHLRQSYSNIENFNGFREVSNHTYRGNQQISARCGGSGGLQMSYAFNEDFENAIRGIDVMDSRTTKWGCLEAEPDMVTYDPEVADDDFALDGDLDERLVAYLEKVSIVADDSTL